MLLLPPPLLLHPAADILFESDDEDKNDEDDDGEVVDDVVEFVHFIVKRDEIRIRSVSFFLNSELNVRKRNKNKQIFRDINIFSSNHFSKSSLFGKEIRGTLRAQR